MIKVVNCKAYRDKSVYVGRPSVLGNPFVIGRDGDRSAVIYRYRRWLWTELQQESGPVFEEIHRLANLAKSGDLILACWCFPHQCHAAVIKAAIEWINLQPQKKDEVMSDNLNETAAEKQCLCCGSYGGDPYAILSNGYCIPCDEDARISWLEKLNQRTSLQGPAQ